MNNMKSKPFQSYNNGNSYTGMNNSNTNPPPVYSNGQTGYMPSYTPPNNYPHQPNYGYSMYNDQIQPTYPNYWQSLPYPQFPYTPIPPAPLQMNKSQSPPNSKSSQKVSLNYNPPKKSQKPAVIYDCKTCDKTFNSARQHETHMSLHKKCPECDFEASKKVLNLHIEECHSKPIDKKFACLNTPEEIAKWIAERKKNYPTDANIQRKKKELQEKIERGEIIPNGKRGAERTNDNPRKKKQKRNNNDDNNGNGEKENSLGLISAYNSESENENSESVNGKTQQKANKKKDKSERICKYFLRGHCSKGDKCLFKHERKSDNKNKNNNQRDNNRKKKSLLRMLLDKEIRNEKNKIFQCIRYIVNNNFFLEDNTNNKSITNSSEVENQTEDSNSEMNEDETSSTTSSSSDSSSSTSSEDNDNQGNNTEDLSSQTSADQIKLDFVTENNHKQENIIEYLSS